LSLGNYAALHPQIVLHEDGGSRLIPDFFLEKMNSDFCDICDLKRPAQDLVRHQRHRTRFRDAVMEGIAQLAIYRDWFESSQNRKDFHSRYGLKGYRPSVVLIVGRRQSYYDEVERIRLESSIPGWLRLVTYDEVVDKARQWRRFAAE
jgi:antiviral defense system Shedu protein SduA